MAFGDRFSSFLNYGIGGGAYLDWLFVGGRVILLGSANEMRGQEVPTRAPDGFDRMTCEDTGTCSLPVFLFAAQVGVVVAHGVDFIFAPALELVASDESVYGYALGLNLPLVWVTHRGVRVGFDLGPYLSFGGSQRAICVGSQEDGSRCGSADVGEIRDFRHSVAGGVMTGVKVGFGFNTPGPAREETGPY